MSPRRGGWFRSSDGQGIVHLLVTHIPNACDGQALEGDNRVLFGGLCGRFANHLCDAPVGETIGGKTITCDAAMCEHHRTNVGPDVDYCPKHAHLAPSPEVAS